MMVPATDLSSSNRPFFQQPTFLPATDLSSSNRPFFQQPIFPYKYPLLFVIPTGANPDFLPRSARQSHVCAFLLRKGA
jgi:hypothetical protein